MTSYERACKVVDELYAEMMLMSQHEEEMTKTILRRKITEAITDALIEFERPQEITHVHIG